MRIRHFWTGRQALTSLILLLLCGCVQQMQSVQPETREEAVSASAQIQKIAVSDDGTSVEILSDRPIVYTYYTLDNPSRVIVDLAQTSADQQQPAVEINKGAVKRIDISKHEFGSGVLSRVELTLTVKSEISAALDQENKKRLLLTIPVPVAVAPEPVKPQEASTVATAVEPAPAAAATLPVDASQIVDPKPVTAENVAEKTEPAAVVAAVAGTSEKQSSAAVQEPVKTEQPETAKIAEKPEPAKEADKPEVVQTPDRAEPSKVEKAAPLVLAASVAKFSAKPDEKILTSISKLDDSLLLEIAGGVDSYKLFRLSQPERLVLDIPKTKSAIAVKTVDINAFGLGKGRLGVAPDKLRIVFDATTAIPAYSAVKSSSGIELLFGETATARKMAAAAPVEPVKESAMVAAPVAPVEPVKEVVNTSVLAAPAEPVQEAVKEVAPAVPSQAVTKEAAVQAAVQQPVETAAVQTEPVKEPAKTIEPQLSAVAPVTAAAVTPAAKPVKKGAGNVEAIEFTQTAGISRITVRTAGGCRPAVPSKSNKGLILTLNDCRVPVKLQRQLDTTGFESAITGISPYSVKGKTPAVRVAVNFKGTLTNSVKREGDAVVWEFTEPVKVLKATRHQKVAKTPKMAKIQKAAPVAADETPAVEREFVEQKQEQELVKNNSSNKATEDAFQLDKGARQTLRQGKTYSGRKVTLEFSDADIRKIFQLLAEVSNKNFLVSDDVTGTITLKLVNVPWDQALDVILENKGLGMQLDGNIVQIRPKTKMKSLDDEAVEMRFAEEKKMPLSTVIFDINFATLGDIETQFKNLKSKRPDASISSDVRTNKIIVVDIDPNIRKMRALLESLDVPEKQVMIEARIVEASSNFVRDIGVKWNFGYQDASASVANINNITGTMGGVVTTGLTGTTGGVAAGMSFGKLLSNIQLDMRLSAASTVGQVKIISTPKVLTVNNKPAKISQGQMIPYQNTSSTDGAKTEFIEAALSLEVTPHITADGSVSMKIKASNNSAGVGSPPPISKKEATTELVVKNGETTVIGGIYVDSETEGDTGVPYLSDIPMLGWLFKSNSKSKIKNEMLIFITPKIMN